MPDGITTKTPLILAALGVSLAVMAGFFATRQPQPAATATATSQTATPASIKRYAVPVSMSQPKLGPDDALVTIVEWCDFHTPGCKQLEPTLEAVLAARPTQARLAFRHFADPTSMPNLEEHEFTHMAFEMTGKFFEAKALLMQAPSVGTRADLEQYARQLGMDWPTVQKRLDSHDYAAAVVADHTFAGMFDVATVPAVFVNGRRLEGAATLASLTSLVDDELARAQMLARGGIARDKIYATIIKDGVWKKPTLERN